MSELDIKIVLSQAKVSHLKNELIKYEQEHSEEVEFYKKTSKTLASNWNYELNNLNDLVEAISDSNYYRIAISPLEEAESELHELQQARSELQPEN